MVKITLKNDFVFKVDSVNESRNISGNTTSINITSVFRDGEPIENYAEITENITSENMSEFTVSIDDKQLYEYTGFTNNLILVKNITQQEQSLYISANK